MQLELPPEAADAFRRRGSNCKGEPMETQEELTARWRVLRQMMIEQLEMFQSGALTLRTAGVNVSEEAIADLKRKIHEFDVLISGAA